MIYLHKSEVKLTKMCKNIVDSFLKGPLRSKNKDFFKSKLYVFPF